MYFSLRIKKLVNNCAFSFPRFKYDTTRDNVSILIRVYVYHFSYHSVYHTCL